MWFYDIPNITTLNLAGTTPGTGFDKIDVAGQRAPHGTLSIVLQSFTPQVGESFQIFTWGTETGTFAQFDLPTLPGGEEWNMSQLYAHGTISVTIAGDVNGDGIVNGQDLALVASNWLAHRHRSGRRCEQRQHHQRAGFGVESAELARYGAPRGQQCNRRTRTIDRHASAYWSR